MTEPLSSHPHYAGFWRRFNAYGIDATIVLAIAWGIGYLTGLDAHAQAVSPEDMKTINNAIAALQGNGQLDPALRNSLETNAQDALVRTLLGGSSISLVNEKLFALISAIYNIAFVVSEWQATPGKRWLGMRVVMADGAPLNWWQATFRHAMSGVSMLLGGIGYVTIPFTKEKLALHDMICNTRVVRVPNPADAEA